MLIIVIFLIAGGPSIPCAWPGDNDSSRSLRADAIAAEDVAVRYADATRGHRSGRYDGPQAYRAARDACMAETFAAVARQHGVGVDEVRAAVESRDWRWDAAVMGSFAILFAFVADRIARTVSQRFDERRAFIALMLFVSIAVSTGAAAIGDLWTMGLEMLRVGNGHMSYRAARIPWQLHHATEFTTAMALFWVVHGRR